MKKLFGLFLIGTGLLGLMGCQEDSVEPLQSPDIIINDDTVDNRGRYRLTLLELFNGISRNEYEIELIDTNDSSLRIIEGEGGPYLVPLGPGNATLLFTRIEDAQSLEVPIRVDWSDDLFINDLEQNNQTSSAITIKTASSDVEPINESDKEYSEDVTIETTLNTVLLYRNDEFLGIFGELASINANQSMTLSRPGNYVIKYRDDIGSLVEEDPIIINPPRLNTDRTNPYQFYLGFSYQLSGLEVIYNNQVVNNNQNIFSDIGKHTIDIQYEDNNNQISVLDAPIQFEVKPHFVINRDVDFDPNQVIYEIERPVRLSLQNNAKTIEVNGEIISDDIIHIRSNGLTNIVINNDETSTQSYSYTFSYTNELQHSIFEYWYVYVGIMILVVSVLYIKIPKVVK